MCEQLDHGSRETWPLTCSLVSLYSLPLTAGAGAAGWEEAAAVELDDPPGTYSLPSRNAFSRAAFSARSRLSASIWALIAARAFASSSFSVRRSEKLASAGKPRRRLHPLTLPLFRRFLFQLFDFHLFNSF